MADNIAVTAGSGTTIATDDIGGTHYQRVKLALGADGTANDASAGAGAVGTGTQRTTLASDDPAVTSLQIIDDWDESDRAKVNPIVGQAGVAAGAGAVGATVVRTTQASDSPLVTAAGSVTETAPASDTASSGLNGRLQRIAQRLTSLIALLPSSIGQKTAAGSISVVPASDAAPIAPTTDGIGAALMTDKIMNGMTALTPKFAAISASTSGDNTLVAAVTSKKIRVLAYNLQGAGAVNARFQTAAAGAYLTGLKYIAAAGGGMVAPFNPAGWFETVAGDLLNLELSGAVAVGGELVYVEV